MRTDAQRIAAYIAKYAPTTVGLKIAAQLTGMKAGYDAVANDLQPIETAIVAVLTADNVVSAQYAMYLSFGRELWKRKKIGGDPALTTDAQLIQDKWESYGNTKSVMINIAADVFGITLV